MKVEFVKKVENSDNNWLVSVLTENTEEFNELRKFVCWMGEDKLSAGIFNEALYGYENDSNEQVPIQSNDAVNHPNHYQGKGGLEVYDVMKGFMTDEEIKGWHKACALKYIIRAGKKDSSKLNEDLKKAIWHLNEWVKMNG